MNRLLYQLKSVNCIRVGGGEFSRSLSVSPQNLFFDHAVNRGNLAIPHKTLPTLHKLDVRRQFKTSYSIFSEESDVVESEQEKKKPIDPSKDRTKIIPPETSIRYLKSAAYKTVYGDEPVWVKYRRNFKGQFTPRRTRYTCIRGGVITTGNPCPICRDEYLVLHYTNVDLLKQFIDPYTGEIYDTRKIHICRKRLLELEVAIEKAKIYGLLTYEVPFRTYNYSEYYPQWQ